jgi:hypothetical protein
MPVNFADERGFRFRMLPMGLPMARDQFGRRDDVVARDEKNLSIRLFQSEISCSSGPGSAFIVKGLS